MSVLHFPRRMNVPRYRGPRTAACGGKAPRGIDPRACFCCAPPGSGLDPEMIAGLKQRLSDASFPSAMEDFFDHVGANPCFIQQGREIEDERLTAALVTVAERVVQKELRLLEIGLLSVEEYAMKHGILFFEDFMGIFVFFEDTGVGILGLADNELFGPTLYARFMRVEEEVVVGRGRERVH